MPYIITTGKRFNYSDAGVEGVQVESRTAVATLDEAWNKLPPGIPDTTLVRERFDLETVGLCQFGPLPDGTVIEVRQVGYVEIAAAVDNKPATWTSEQSILAAFNAA
jgi:hypothetical protein